MKVFFQKIKVTPYQRCFGSMGDIWTPVCRLPEALGLNLQFSKLTWICALCPPGYNYKYNKNTNTKTKTNTIWPGTAQPGSGPQEMIPQSSQLRVAELKQFSGPLGSRPIHKASYIFTIGIWHLAWWIKTQIPPESPAHASFFFPEAQSIVSSTFWRPI